MPIKILMPALSPTMKEGNLVRWLKKQGDTVEAGEVIAEIETDKATMEVEAVDEGKLARIIVPEGTEAVPVNAVIAVLLEEGEDESLLETLDLESEVQSKVASERPEDQKKPAEVLDEKDQSSAQDKEISFSGSTTSIQETSELQQPPLGGRVFATPLARRLAAEKGIDLATIPGSGPRGRVIKADVEKAQPSAGLASSTTIAARTEGLPPFEKIKLSNMRKVIAQRLTESKQEVPHFYLTISCNIDKLLDVRKEVNASYPDDKVSVNDMVIRACALALRDVPDANVAWADDHMRRYQASDISVAVAVQDGLLTPVVRDAQIKNVVQISREMKDLVARARAGKLKPEEFQGGTMSLSNLGMFGIQEFGAIVNPPQGCILAVGAGEKRPVVVDDKLAIATMMTCTLSVDHRAIDGAVGSELLRAFKSYIESPLRLVI